MPYFSTAIWILTPRIFLPPSMPRAKQREHAKSWASGQHLWERTALSQDGRGDGGGGSKEERRRDGGAHEADADRRRRVRHGQHRREWPRRIPGLPIPGEDRGGEPGSLGYLQVGLGHAGSGGADAARSDRV